MKQNMHDLLRSLPEEVVNHIQHLERIRQDFVANVSHELRTPLTVIHGYLEALLDQDLEETRPWKKIFLQMHQQTLRMENLVENLLLLSRIEGREIGKRVEQEIDVPRLLKNICAEAKELSGDLKHKINLHADETLKLIGWEEEFYSLFSNVIFNAVKYTPAKGKVDVQWYKKNNMAYFIVSDTGIGIAKEHIPKLTERFYRVDPARTRASGGTGLGLALVKHIMLSYGGKLMIESELGKGSVFTCLFPV